MSYGRFVAMIATSTVVMYGLMYLNTYAFEHVFWSEARTQLDGPNLRRAFRLILKKSGLVDFHFHDLRHTFATRMCRPVWISTRSSVCWDTNPRR